MNNFLENLTECLRKLRPIQDGFDVYQLECFAAKPPEFFCLELNGEAGELANLEKKSWKGKPPDFFRFEDEAADVFIALMNYCNAKNVDLESAVIDKLNKIETKRTELEKLGEKF